MRAGRSATLRETDCRLTGRPAALILGLAAGAFAQLALALPPAGPPAPASGCVRASTHARIDWKNARIAPQSTARVYFHSANALTEHYLEMRRRSGGGYWAVLPKTSVDTPYFEYRIVTLDEKGQATTREKRRVAVSADCAAAPPTAEEAKPGDRLVIGSDVEGPSVPVGFLCEGIIGLITPRGELQAYNACNELALATAAIRRQKMADRTNAQQPLNGVSPAGLPIGPTHHRTPRRAPLPPKPPQPRLTEPVSQSRP